MPPRFKHKPTFIEPIQWTGHNIDEILEFVTSAGWHGRAGDQIFIKTARGNIVPVRVNDWIVPDLNPRTFYPIDPAVMEELYERVP